VSLHSGLDSFATSLRLRTWVFEIVNLLLGGVFVDTPLTLKRLEIFCATSSVKS
jgi:hypothetical protein